MVRFISLFLVKFFGFGLENFFLKKVFPPLPQTPSPPLPKTFDFIESLFPIVLMKKGPPSYADGLFCRWRCVLFNKKKDSKPYRP
nr:hypothetical protein [Bilophila wadsworthia]